MKWILAMVLGTSSSAMAQAPGSIAGEFSVGESGAAAYNVALSLPPGTAGLTPALSLNYSSSGPSGSMGPGLSLAGLSSITRCGANIPTDGYISGVRMDVTDKFCLDGQKLMVLNGTSGTVEYRTQIESFSRITSYTVAGISGPGYFVVELKNGQKLEYGVTPDSRLKTSLPVVLSWNLNKVTDRLGNYYTVSYFQDTNAGFALPQTISYTGNTAGNLAPYNQVVISYEPRTSPKESYVNGQLFTLQHRISHITTFAENTQATSYNLTYSNDIITHEDLLAGIQQCSSTNNCLAPTTFAWTGTSQQSSSFVPFQTFQNLSPGQGFSSSSIYPIFTGDFNGDGLTDLMRVQQYDTLTCLNSKISGFSSCHLLSAFGQQYFNDNNSRPMVLGDWTATGRTGVARTNDIQVRPFVTNPDGTWISHLPDLNALTSAQGYNDQTRDPLFTGDWNGDGRTDIARWHLSGNGLFVMDFRLANGAGFDSNAIAIITLSDPNNYYPYVFTGDWDGDGRSDFGVTWEDRPAGTNQLHLWRSTGMGFTLFENLPQPVLSAGNDSFTSQTMGVFVGDWNGDGLSDLAMSGYNGIKFYRSTGANMAFWYDLNDLGRDQIPGVNGATVEAYPFISGDWNGDGKSDIARVRSNNIRFYTATATGFELFSTLSDLTPAQGYNDNTTRPILTGDWNGDGVTDIGRVGANGVVMYVQSTTESPKIGQILDGLSKETQIIYKNLSDPSVYVKGTAAVFPAMDVQGAGSVVSRVRNGDGLGSFAAVTYHYASLILDNDRRDSKGFGRVDMLDETTGITTSTTFNQQYPFENKVLSTERRLPSGALIERSSNTWATTTPSTVSILPITTQSIDEQYDLSGSLTLSSTTNRTFDVLGNITQNQINRSDGSTEMTVNTYYNNTTLWIIGQLNNTTVTKHGGGINPPPAITRSTTFIYLGQTGLLFSEIPEYSNPAYRISKNYTYDVFGNNLTTTVIGVDFTQRTLTKSYDSKGRFVTQVTNALGQTESRQYDPKTGAITAVTDMNGLITQHTYDGFGRLILENRPDGTQSQTTYSWPDQSAPSNAAYFITTTATAAPTSKVYYDELGRDIRGAVDGFGAKQIIKDKVYDARGDLVLVSEPYFDGDPILWNAIDYDVLGRTIRNTNPGNLQTVYSYNGFATTVTNPAGQTRTEVVDSLGKILSATDTQGNTITFKRDSYGNPLQIIDSAGNITTIQYDLTGRKTQMTDPDSGTTTYTYNHLGELLTETNALGQVTSYSYDLLGRPTARVSTDGTDAWIYDSAPHGIGKISATYGLHGYNEQYSYDTLSRLIQTTTTIGGRQFSVTQTYDSSGRPSTVTYPSGWGIKSSYNQNGYLQAILQVSDNATIWKALSQNARGQIESQSFGNGLNTTQTFDPIKGYLTHITTGNVQNLGFQYDTLGNLTQRSDIARSLTENFVYDNLNRLTSSQVVGQNQVQVSYNSIGNITYRSDVGTYSYPSAASVRPHAVTSITGPQSRAFNYDLRGGRISSGTGNINYSVSGHPIYLREGNNSIQFDLDPSDTRVEERTYQGSTLTERKQFIAGGLFERVEKGANVSLVHYVKGPAGYIAQKVINTTMSGTVTGGSINYLHLDHLGSIQTITDERQNIKEVLSFDSWGNRRDPYTWAGTSSRFKPTIDRGFTGHEQLDAVSLIHMNGRVYDPVIGRFISPDPFIEQPGDMQAYNRYSYVYNNPLSYTDPSGHFSFRSLRKLVLRTTRMLIRQAITNAVMAVANTVGGPIFGPFLAAYAGNFTNSLMSGNGLSRSFHAGFRHLVVNALHAKLDNLIGHGFGGDGGFSKYGPMALAAAHAVGDAGYAAATGGNVRAAFMSGFGGSYGASAGGSLSSLLGCSAQVAGHIGAAIGGGTAAALGGGKFEDGAMRGAFIYMYNHSFPGMEQAAGEAMATAQMTAMLSTKTANTTPSIFWEVIGDFGGSISNMEIVHPVGYACMNTLFSLAKVTGGVAFDARNMLLSQLSNATMLFQGPVDAGNRLAMRGAYQLGANWGWTGSPKTPVTLPLVSRSGIGAYNVVTGALGVGIHSPVCVSGLYHMAQ